MRPRAVAATLLAGLLCLAACGPKGPTAVTAPDTARTGDAGADGPFGAAFVRARTQARLSEQVAYEVDYPATADGTPDPAGSPDPVVVLEQGGLVAPPRYRWLAAHLATRGYVVVMADHTADLAITQVDNGRLALDAVLGGRGPAAGLVDPGGPVAVVGHSLGGVVATWEWLADDRLTALGLLASYPQDGDPVGDRAGSPELSLAGTDDGQASVADVRAGSERFAAPKVLGVVSGMTHFAWTDDPKASELAKDGHLGRPLAEVRRDALGLLDTWLDAVLRHDPGAAQRLASGTFPGVEVTR